MLLLLMSPAKTMREHWQSSLPIPTTEPPHKSKAHIIARHMKHYTSSELAHILSVNENLATLNAQRWRRFFKLAQIPAVMAYEGPGFKALNPTTWQRETWIAGYRHLRIISGLYGYLRVSDAIRPYRLEMDSRITSPDGLNDKTTTIPSAWWRATVTKSLIKDIRSIATITKAALKKSGTPPVVIDMTSHQYSSAVAWQEINALFSNLIVVRPRFAVMTANNIKPPGQQIKILRGILMRHIIEQLASMDYTISDDVPSVVSNMFTTFTATLFEEKIIRYHQGNIVEPLFMVTPIANPHIIDTPSKTRAHA